MMKLKEARELMVGCDAFETRLISLKDILDTNKDYPLTLRMFGFPGLNVNCKEELKSRIDELQDLLNVTLMEDNNNDS